MNLLEPVSSSSEIESNILSAADRLTPFSPDAASVILDKANALNSTDSGDVSAGYISERKEKTIA